MLGTTRSLEWGQLVRLILAILWILGLGLYCISENGAYFFIVAPAVDHQSKYSDTAPDFRESYHVDIARERPASTTVDWQVLRKVEQSVDRYGSLVQTRAGWYVLNSPLFDTVGLFPRTHYLITIVPSSDRDIINAPDTHSYATLTWILGILFIFSGLFFPSILVWDGAAKYTPHVVGFLFFSICGAQIWITFLQGGLIASPLGGAFTTMAALLVANGTNTVSHAVSIWKNASYFLPALILCFGSIIAHHYAIQTYSEGVLLALQQIHGHQYFAFVIFSLVFGIAALGSRRLERLQSKVVIRGE